MDEKSNGGTAPETVDNEITWEAKRCEDCLFERLKKSLEYQFKPFEPYNTAAIAAARCGECRWKENWTTEQTV